MYMYVDHLIFEYMQTVQQCSMMYPIGDALNEYPQHAGGIRGLGPIPENHKSTQPAFYVGPSTARQQNGILNGVSQRKNGRPQNGVSLAGRWWPTYSGIWILSPLIN